MSLAFFNGFLIAMVATAIAVFASLFFVDAGYGQYVSKRWGKSIDNRAGWVIMHCNSPRSL